MGTGGSPRFGQAGSAARIANALMMSKQKSDAVGLGIMLVVLLFLFGLLAGEAAAGNWFTAILLGIPIVPCIVGVGALFVGSLRRRDGQTSG
jgi:hypothetical protein